MGCNNCRRDDFRLCCGGSMHRDDFMRHDRFDRFEHGHFDRDHFDKERFEREHFKREPFPEHRHFREERRNERSDEFPFIGFFR